MAYHGEISANQLMYRKAYNRNNETISAKIMAKAKRNGGNNEYGESNVKIVAKNNE
jgi:hypothetical protein